MSDPSNHDQWRTLDKDLNRVSRVEYATLHLGRTLVGLGLALAFILLATLVAALVVGHTPGVMVVILAAGFGAYMALNIGANDVANNMGPAVGAKALTMAGAIAIAAICESAGALLAGGDVVATISSGIVSPESLADAATLTWAMLAALLAAALWINLATWLGAPVSTTHSVVGGVLGAGIAAAGLAAVNWPVLAAIAGSWIVSPLMGGTVAALLLALIKSRIGDRDDMIAAARVWLPALVGLMAGCFAIFLALKAASHLMVVDTGRATLVGIACGLAAYGISHPIILRQSRGMENRDRSIKKLFALPLVISAALLSFAHGANDVANAVGPLAAIVHAQQSGAVAGAVAIPIWVMMVGALGISLGLILFGPRLIGMVGSQITKLNPMRAFCVSLSAAITVILASWAGLPVSSTHTAVGGVFGVGFYREWQAERRARTARRQSVPGKPIAREERERRKLVRRSHFLSIVAAWVITVPATAVLSALGYLAFDLMFG